MVTPRRWLALVSFAAFATHAPAQPPTGSDTGAAAAAGNGAFRGGKVEWARLRHSGDYWNRHSEADDNLLEFFRERTSLNIDPSWRAASARNLVELCNYPFIFADRVDTLGEAEQRNMAEYLKRGGFLLIDCCCNTGINPSPEDYLARQVLILQKILPGLRMTPLPRDHEVYSTYFKLRAKPPRAQPGNSWMDSRDFPLHGLYLEDRLVGIFTMSGLQCAWAGVSSSTNATECMQMMTNLYLYAITR